MKLFVIGANGKTGREILDLAGTRGHQVTAFVRSPDKLRLAIAHRAGAARSLTIVSGDPRRPESIAAALPGHDAVLSAIGRIRGMRCARARCSPIACARRWRR